MADPIPSPSGQQRPYRSKKRKPCDACRRRRTGCVVEEGQQACSLCRHRGLSCTFLSSPPKKKCQRPLDSNSIPPTPTTSRNTPSQLAEDASQSTTTASVFIPGQTTIVPGQSFLYSGLSGDQNVNLLRHLPFDNSVFGTSNWTIWRAADSFTHNAYFTIYPDALLDVEGNAFDTSQIPTSAATHHCELLNLYYKYVHPTLPILETRSEFETAIAAKTVPASLISAVYSLAVFFWPYSIELQDKPRVPRNTLQKFAYKSLMIEIRHPTIRTLQALILYLQFPPGQMREPNHPGSWPVTAQAVAVAQEIGLHVDPEGWKISPQEYKLRRILWWTVYIQDKWLATWLGRPSHIIDQHFTVKKISITDFTNEWGILDAASSSSIQGFISLCHLTQILADVLDAFYSLQRPLSSISTSDVLSLTDSLARRLEEWRSQHMFTGNAVQGESTNSYALAFAYYAIEALLRGAVFVSTGSTSGGLSHESELFDRLFGCLEQLLSQNPTGLWLSYCKGSLGIIGSFILTIFLSSVDDTTLNNRQAVLQRYRKLLNDLSVRFEFAKLPSIRLNLLFRRVFPGVEEEEEEGEEEMEDVDGECIPSI